MNDSMVPYMFVIDTTLYAGNFEREMCAYMTALTGDCGKGEDEAELAYKEIPGKIRDDLADRIMSPPDEYGVCRPVSIYQSPGKNNDYRSLAIAFGERPSMKIIKFLKDRAYKYAKKKPCVKDWNKHSFDGLKIVGFRLVKTVVKETKENV